MKLGISFRYLSLIILIGLNTVYAANSKSIGHKLIYTQNRSTKGAKEFVTIKLLESKALFILQSDRTILFDQAKQTITHLNPNNKTFTTLTVDQVLKVSSTLKEASKGIQKKLAEMPEEKRQKAQAQIEKLGLSVILAENKGPSWQVKETNQKTIPCGKKKFGMCRKTEIWQNDQIMGTGLITNLETLKLSPQTNKTISELGKILSNIIENLGQKGVLFTLINDKTIPISLHLKNQKTEKNKRDSGQEISLTTSENYATDGQEFEIPKDFKQSGLPTF